ncbi:GRAM domain containing [Seminavis robusta]|uniref:GRAM domain containing n=1 Tax=Seminavis robusta TaxID=568900 RepID=A0A9N8E7G2_9STRA|nr:GRAM domain containing [Seminavis robusta]|eukprot:Sro625_g177540.1 GRAM domain containing (696) ;mRNA; r:18449-20644
MADETVVATYDGRNMEELIGFVEEEFPCRWQGVSGTLYAGTDGLAFLGKFFLFDKKMNVKWIDVKIQQSDHGVTIQTRDVKEEMAVIYDFTGIHKPERCWSMLVSLHNRALLDRTRTPASGVTASTMGRLEGEGATDEAAATRARSQTAAPIHRRMLRRQTSDPAALAPAIEALFAEEAKEEAMAGDSTQTPGQSNGSSVPLLERPLSARRVSSILMSPSKQQTISDNSATPPSSTQKETDRAASLRASASSAVGVVEVSPTSEIEAIVGKIQGRFSCLYNGQPGNLYAGSTALYFAGSRLFFAARLTIQSLNIRQVQMVKGKPKSDVNDAPAADMVKEQGIVVWTREGISHTFLGMENPDQVWASLVAIRNHVSSNATATPRSFGMVRRMNSDPNLQSHTGGDLLSPTAIKVAAEAEKSREEQELGTPVMSDEELQEAWSDVTAKKNRYNTGVVKDHKFACNVDQFFKKYFGDDAEFSLAKFLTGQGDKDVKASPWKPTKQNGKIVRSRVVRYIHPISAPMAPPEAKARKEQTYQRFGNHGFIVETKTFVDDVPMTDCFFVKDRILVASLGEENKGHVLLSWEFELEFVKGTMFRGIITSTTNRELTAFGKEMKKYMVKNRGEEVSAPEEEKEVEKEIVIAEEPPSLLPGGVNTATITHGLLGLVVVMQFWILLEMWSMKRAIGRIEYSNSRPA